MRPLLAALAAAASTAAQFVARDATARNLTVVRSPGDDNVTVAYRQPDGVCTTAFARQTQYTGWVSVPGDYPANLFFWYVGARSSTDRLTIWLNGGPGSSSLYGFFTGNGPCEVVERGLGRYETVAREWGWDRASNMLFIDQPNKVGFSYDTPTDGTLMLLDGRVAQPPVPRPADAPAWSVVNGTFSANGGNSTANTTHLAAMATWHVVQGFLAALPLRDSPRPPGAPVAVNLFAESYGGVYGPVFAEVWEAQNQRRLAGQLDRNATVEVRLESLGIVNGCIDLAVETGLQVEFARNNTYGFEALTGPRAQYLAAKNASPGGCAELATRCETAALRSDPEGRGDRPDVAAACARAAAACGEIRAGYEDAGRSVYDIANPLADPFPPLHFADYLNQAGVQAALGSPVNFTLQSRDVLDNFAATGDVARGGNIGRLARLVGRGVRVGLVYGDRDYVCNWLGGEAVSLLVAQQAGAPYAGGFAAAGYEPIVVNDSYVGGEVRQLGNLSFARVYQAGHAVAAYQPETAFQVFARILLGRAVSSGAPVDLAAFATTGAPNSTRRAALPPPPRPTCFVAAFAASCDAAAAALAARAAGVVVNGVLYSRAADWAAPAPAPPPSSTQPAAPDTMTGVFVATATPASPARRAAAGARPALRAWGVGVVLVALRVL